MGIRSLLLGAMCSTVLHEQAPAGAITIDQAVTEAVDHNLGLLAPRYNVTIRAGLLVLLDAELIP